jgi:hypothetical protein
MYKLLLFYEPSEHYEMLYLCPLEEENQTIADYKLDGYEFKGSVEVAVDFSKDWPICTEFIKA